MEDWETFFFQKRIAFILFLILVCGEGKGAQNGDGCTRRLRPRARKSEIWSQVYQLGRKLSVCSAEVVRFQRPTRKSTEFTKRETGLDEWRDSVFKLELTRRWRGSNSCFALNIIHSMFAAAGILSNPPRIAYLLLG